MKKTKILSALLAVSMLFSISSLTVSADSTAAEEVTKITSIDDLNKFRTSVNGNCLGTDQ